MSMEAVQIGALVVSAIVIMIGQADSGQGGILLTGLAGGAATFVWIATTVTT